MVCYKERLNIALNNIGSNYRKILLVNLTTDSYQPVTIGNDEASIVKTTDVMSEYWQWFCNSELIHKDDKESCLKFVPQPYSHIVYRRKYEKDFRWVLLEIIPTSDYSESNKNCVLYVRDINDIYVPEYEALVERIGTKDTMTGLCNKIAFERDKERFKNEKVGVIFIDVNGLKYTNDNFGHKAGDDLILKVANLITINFSGYRCYHISGDEFVVCAFGESLREFLARAVSFHKSFWVSMEVPCASIGYSIGERGEFKEAYAEAEKEMYDDKRLFYCRFPKYKRDK